MKLNVSFLTSEHLFSAGCVPLACLLRFAVRTLMSDYHLSKSENIGHSLGEVGGYHNAGIIVKELKSYGVQETDFMFQLNDREFDNMKSQIVISN